MSFNKPLSDGEPIDVDETQQPQYPDDAFDTQQLDDTITPTQEMPPIENRSPNANGQDRQPVVPTLDNTAPSFYSGGSILAASTRFAVDSGGSILAASIDQTTDLIYNSSKQPGRKYDSRASSSTDPDPKKARH
jgi:hypothetical protein